MADTRALVSSRTFLTPRLAVVAVFVAFGSGVGLWAGSLAEVASRSGINAQWLGYAITGIIGASMLGMMMSGMIARHFALRSLLLASLAAVAVVMIALLQAASLPAFMLLTFLIGLTGGVLDGLMNAEGYAVERELGRPVIASFHAVASLAAGLLAVVGSYVTVQFGTFTTAVLTTLCYVIAFVVVIAATPDRGIPPAVIADGKAGRGYGIPIILLALIVGLCTVGETVAALFSGPFLNVQAPELAAYAGAGTTAFALCQFLIRIVADRFRRRFDDLVLIEVSVVVTAVGFGVVALSGSFAQSVIGFGIIGLGTACIVPCGFALAPKFSGLAAAQAFGVLAMISAVTRVPAPLAFGEVAERASYPIAFFVIVVLLAAALALTFVLKRVPLPGTSGSSEP